MLNINDIFSRQFKNPLSLKMLQVIWNWTAILSLTASSKTSSVVRISWRICRQNCSCSTFRKSPMISTSLNRWASNWSVHDFSNRWVCCVSIFFFFHLQSDDLRKQTKPHIAGLRWVFHGVFVIIAVTVTPKGHRLTSLHPVFLLTFQNCSTVATALPEFELSSWWTSEKLMI